MSTPLTVGRRVGVAGDRAGDVGAVLLDGLGGVAALDGLVVEDLGATITLLFVSEVVAELGLGRVAGVVEARMGLSMPVSTMATFTPSAGGCSAAAVGGPGGHGLDDPEVRVVHGRVVEALVFGASDQCGGPQLGQGRAIEADRHGVEADVPAAGDPRLGGVHAEPLLEVVAQGGELGPVGLRGRAREVDLLARRGLRLGVRGQGLALELDEGHRAIDRGSSGGRVGRGRAAPDRAGRADRH